MNWDVRGIWSIWDIYVSQPVMPWVDRIDYQWLSWTNILVPSWWSSIYWIVYTPPQSAIAHIKNHDFTPVTSWLVHLGIIGDSTKPYHKATRLLLILKWSLFPSQIYRSYDHMADLGVAALLDNLPKIHRSTPKNRACCSFIPPLRQVSNLVWSRDTAINGCDHQDI